MHFSSGWGVIAYLATLTFAYFLGKSKRRHVENTESEPLYEETQQEVKVIDYQDMDKERQFWRLQAHEQKLADQLKQVRRQKKTFL